MSVLGRHTMHFPQDQSACSSGIDLEDSQAQESKREQRLVNPANHDSGVFLPMLDIAVMRERRAHPPRQQRPTNSPKQSQQAIDSKIEVRLEAHAAVQDNSHSECSDGEEGRCHELS